MGLLGSCGRKINEHITGLRVNATTVESNTDTAMVILNWRYSCPVMPDRKLTGTNTAASTIEVAIKAPVSPFIAFLVASYGLRCSSSMMRSTFSTTTMASSTTSPMASTSPSRVRMFSEKPKISMKPNVPIKEIGTAMVGISVARQLCRERNTTTITRNKASNRVLYTSWMDSEIYVVMSNGISYFIPSGKFRLISSMVAFTRSATSMALAPGSMYTPNTAALPPLIPLSVL